MRVWSEAELLEDATEPRLESVVTIGFFDGVHVGHRALIRQLRADAARQGCQSVVVTFDRHPAAVVRPESAPALLCTLEQRLELLAATGVDAVVVVHFDEERSREDADHFVRRVLVDGLHTRRIVVGADFHFGHERRGNVARLTELGTECGFDVEGLVLVGPSGEAGPGGAHVSSTAIRKAFGAGDVASVNAMLGRPHEMRGTVEAGDARGRTWGFPTANVAIDPGIAMPGSGIYAGWAIDRTEITRGPLSAAIYVGNRPTVYGADGSLVLEVHLLDWAGDLYGHELAVRFTHHIRGDAKFDSFDELVAQIQRDCDVARGLLAAG